MKLLSKRVSLFFVVIYAMQYNCVDNMESEQEGFTSEAQVYVDRILKENNTTNYVIDIVDVSISGGYSSPRGYHLGLVVDKQIVLTNTIDSLRLCGTYRFDKSNYGTGGGLVDLPFMGISAKGDTLDSIQIITDSVIVMQDLGFGYSNLTHLPPEIGKVRVQSLDISYNYPSLTSLPDELMQLSEAPTYWDTLIVKYDIGAVKSMTTVSDSLKSWLEKYSATW